MRCETLVNNIIEGNCVEVMRNFDDNVIDLTITSPPYDSPTNKLYLHLDEIIRYLKGKGYVFERL